MEQSLGVIAVLCALGLTLWLLRAKGLAYFKGGPRRRSGDLVSVDRLPLGPQHSLHLVRLGDRALLISVSPAGCSVIETMPYKSIEDSPRRERQ